MDQKQIPAAIIIAALIIGGAILLRGSTNQQAVNINSGTQSGDLSKIRPISKDEHILGNPNAKIMIVEYSDTECPFCKMFHTTLHDVVKQFNGEVAWAYRHFPIPSLHPKAPHEAEALECATELGGNSAFWKYTDEIYARTQSNNKLDVAELPKIASDTGLNLEAFNTCLASGKYTAKVQKDIDNGNTIGVQGTPFSVILKGGKVVGTIPGAQPIDKIVALIKSLQ